MEDLAYKALVEIHTHEQEEINLLILIIFAMEKQEIFYDLQTINGTGHAVLCLLKKQTGSL